ncbi:Mdm10/Mdm12/Mmm1 complex subunit Mmm1 [Schizosaccharomyces japonicus yFS275]|uniref:Maintenance of mitochondrial morphology protein 1 n=1 Tax=Schizosaccharomyces japonicus (strain yFS275 / FY16936) TaxID=402676 RepID=MMM1_SCHJY|nr:Mdm10/Mdm12/Mmm1 complex subunit Mmm1 [Schizosaccharomyces japonicus yFS275]B6K6N3.2 RecName: Full=Maintenance of mitochondrial morphology protein 1 [Schizosaccharomyces japonicus yFS275]EEB09187.2 Mdm10/Mdm12/Mmm1 complex subunit Mmm1 [Schizosaccharomyces japonicus yFS275]
MVQLFHLTFTQGFFIGQLSVIVIVYIFLRFFLFCTKEELKNVQEESYPLSPSNEKSTTEFNDATHKVTPSLSEIYDVKTHEEESLDWFNVLVAQALSQIRQDAVSDDAALKKLQTLFNGKRKPSFLGPIHIKSISLGQRYPVFSNCRIQAQPDDTNGLRATMDLSLEDDIHFVVNTSAVLNVPRPAFAMLPVSLSVRIVHIRGKLSIYFSQSSKSAKRAYLNFTFDPDFDMGIEIQSLVGSRSKLQDIPKIAHIIETRIRKWFITRCVSPQFQQISIPNIWPSSAREGHRQKSTE